jgi:PAS domain S-box-containing protein
VQRLIWPAAFLVTTLGCGSVWLGSIIADRAMVLRAAERDLTATARLLGEHADRAFEAGDKVVQAIAEAALEAGPSLGEEERRLALHRQIARLVSDSPQIASAWLLDAEGATLAENWSHPPRTQASARARGYFQVHLAGMQGLHVGELSHGPHAGSMRFTLSRPVLSADGQFAGVAVAGVFSDYFARVYAEVGLGDSTRFTLLRANGDPLAVWPQAEQAPPRVLERPPPRDGVHLVPDLSGEMRMVAAWTLPNHAASILVSQPLRALLADWRERTLLSGGAIALLLAVLGALTVLGSRGAKREAELRRALKAEHRLLERRVAERTAALAWSEARLRLALHAGGLGLLWHDREGGFIGWSAELTPLLGLPAARRQATEAEFLALVHAEDRPAVKSALAEARRGGELQREFRIIRPSDGGLRWLDWRAAAWRNGAAPGDRMEGVAADITTRKDAEQRQLVLTREVHHRAKNALAVAQAAMRLTQADSKEEFTRAVEGRVAALARAHTLLSEGDWSGADLRPLVAGELAPFLAPGPEGTRARIEGPEVTLAASSAQPLAMALHELATNAIKHGALSCPGGRLSVVWRVEAGGTWLCLDWREEGGPPVASPTPGSRRGFGSRVLEATIRAQLGGSIVQEWCAEGLRCRIRLPLGRGSAEAVLRGEPQPASAA